MNTLSVKTTATRQTTGTSTDPTAANQTIHNLFVQHNFSQCLDVIEEQVTAFNGGCEYPLYVKGLILRQEGRVQESLGVFQQVVELNPGNLDNVKQVAKTYMLLGRFQEAIDNFDDALSKSQMPDWECLHNKAMCLQQLGQVDEAVDVFLSAIAAEPHQVTLCALGKLYANLGKFEEALQHYTDALNLSPENVDLLTTVGIMHLRMGNADKAFENFGAALSVDAHHPSVCFFSFVGFLFILTPF